MIRRATFIITAMSSAAVLLVAVCQDSDTPGQLETVPYTVVAGGDRDAVVAIDPSRDPGDEGLDNVYFADLVNAAVHIADTVAFEAALHEQGLVEYHRTDPSPGSSRTTHVYMVWVPRGAALSAQPVIAGMPGVEEAWISYIGTMIRPNG